MRILLLVLPVLLVCACSSRYVRISGFRAENLLHDIAERQHKIEQVKAVLDIRGTGLIGQLFHERADLIAKNPHFLLLSLRSFFDTPALMLASNGQYLTMFDFTGQSKTTYQKAVIGVDSLAKIFDWQFHPAALISIVLGCFPLNQAKDLEVSLRGELLRVTGDQAFAWHITALYDQKSMNLKEITWQNHSLKISLCAQYREYRLIDGHERAQLLVVKSTNPGGSLAFDLRFTDLEINGSPILPDTFYLHPH